MNHTKFKIAIDGGTHSGCVCFDNRTRRIVYAETLDFWRVFDYVTAGFKPSDVEVIIESLNTRAALYARSPNVAQKTRDCIAAKIGSVRRETELLAVGLERRGYNVRRVPPVRAAKWTADDVKRYTGYVARTSQHVRDAIRLLFFSPTRS